MEQELYEYESPCYLDFEHSNQYEMNADSYFSRYRSPEKELNAQKEPINLSENTNTDPLSNSQTNILRRSLSVGQMNVSRTTEVDEIVDTMDELKLEKKEQTVRGRVKSTEDLLNINKRKPTEDHSRPRKLILMDESSKLNRNQMHKHLTTTIAQSPLLLTKARSRPVYALSREEKEEIELEDMKKKQFKAQDLNQQVFARPKVKVQKKPNTKPQPFNLTEVKKKVFGEPKPENFVFTSQSGLPKNFAGKGELNSSPTPFFTNKSRFRITRAVFNDDNGRIEHVPLFHQGLTIQKPLAGTKIQPFSFDARDSASRAKKEDKIKKVFEEEKKAREFHARPVPKYVLNATITTGYQSSRNSSCSNEENKDSPFKARPATVLYKEPFRPAKSTQPLVQISEFTLNTNRRAKEREIYDQNREEKELLLEKKRKEFEELQMKIEKEEITRIRREVVHKAAPVRMYKLFQVKDSDKKLTIPQSPGFAKKH